MRTHIIYVREYVAEENIRILERSNKKLRKILNGELHNIYVLSNDTQGRHIKGEMCAKTVRILALQVCIKMHL